MVETSIPRWLDEKFLRHVFEVESSNGPINILSFSALPACAPGENYMSHIFRVQVEYETGVTNSHQSASLVVKVPLEDGFVKEFCEKHNFFAKEPKLYSEVLPAMKKHVLCEFGPKSLYSPVKNVVVMKDLKEAGYFNGEKTNQLDYFQCKTVFEKLAKFHAASVISVLNNKSLIVEVGKDCFYTEGSPSQQFITSAMNNLLKIVREDERYAVFADYLTDRQNLIWPSCMKLNAPKSDGGFNVLNHGDLRSNNLLFKYSTSGDVLDVKFIDYQLTKIASPVVDLVYFIWSSANEEVREKRQKDLFHIYLDTLNETLADLGCEERLSVEELRADLLGAVDWAIVTVSYIPFMMASPEDVPDLGKLTTEDSKSESVTNFFKCNSFIELLPNNIASLSQFFFAGKGLPE